MASGTAGDAQVVQATRNLHDGIREAFGSVAELVFGNATDLHSGNRMLHAHAGASQVAIVPFLARLQFCILGLFFGWRCARTAGA